MVDAKPEPVIHGITATDWGVWRNSPVTLAFRKYLTDYADQLGADHVERWRGGKLDPDFEAEARGRINAALEIEGLGFEHLLIFYGPQGTGNAAEADQDDLRELHGAGVDGKE